MNTNTVTALTTAISADAVATSFAQLVPLISVAVLSGITFYFGRKLIKGISKGKTRI